MNKFELKTIEYRNKEERIENIKYSPVYSIDEKTVGVMRANSKTSSGKFAGILVGVEYMGDGIEQGVVIVSGDIVNDKWNWVTDEMIFINAYDDGLTQNPRATFAFIQPIGKAISPTKIRLNPLSAWRL